MSQLKYKHVWRGKCNLASLSFGNFVSMYIWSHLYTISGDKRYAITVSCRFNQMKPKFDNDLEKSKYKVIKLDPTQNHDSALC